MAFGRAHHTGVANTLSGQGIRRLSETLKWFSLSVKTYSESTFWIRFKALHGEVPEPNGFKKHFSSMLLCNAVNVFA